MAATSSFDTRTSLFGVYDTLTEEQTAKVNQLRDRVQSVDSPPTYREALRDFTVLFLAKWLFARKWNVDDAAAMYANAAAYRHHHRLDSRPLFPAMRKPRGYDEEVLRLLTGTPKRGRESVDLTEDAFSDISPSRWHFWDRAGRPVLIERSGFVQVDKLVERCYMLARPGEHFAKRYADYDRYVNEIGAALIKFRNERAAASPAEMVHQCTVVMDMKGMGLKHLAPSGLELIKASTEVAQEYYPEGLHRVYCVNAPALAKVAWGLLKPFLDRRVQEKVSFHKPGDDTRNALVEAIGTEHLPRFLGGDCDCAGGCVPVAGDRDAPDRWSAVDKTFLTNVKHVKAGSRAVAEFAVTSEEAMRWSLNVDAHDIDVASVTLHGSAASSGQAADLAVPGRCQHAEGTVTAPAAFKCSTAAPCMLRMDLNNVYSWVQAKDVRWRVEPQRLYDADVAEDVAARDRRYTEPDLKSAAAAGRAQP